MSITISKSRMAIAIRAFSAIYEELRERKGITEELRKAKLSIQKGRIILATLNALGIYRKKEATLKAQVEETTGKYVETRRIPLSNGGHLQVVRKGKDSHKDELDLYSFTMDPDTAKLVNEGREEIHAAMAVV